jgi:CubicO group peptidase (beta-lactamase class C family)
MTNKIEGSGILPELPKEPSSKESTITPIALAALQGQTFETAHEISGAEVQVGSTKASSIATAKLDTVGMGPLSPTQKMDAYLQSMEKEAFFTGTVLVKEGERTILHKGYGMATDDLPNTPSTVFHVGSITKQFTAAAIMKLREEGQIALENPINECLPEEYRLILQPFSKHSEHIFVQSTVSPRFLQIL